MAAGEKRVCECGRKFRSTISWRHQCSYCRPKLKSYKIEYELKIHIKDGFGKPVCGRKSWSENARPPKFANETREANCPTCMGIVERGKQRSFA